MQTKTIDGIKYIGVLEVPELSLQLPVMSHWSLAGLKIAPGRYKRNIIIAGHNYRSHFSRLKTLDIGSKIWFIDVEGNRFEYKVSDIEIIKGTNGKRQMGYDTIYLYLWWPKQNGTALYTYKCSGW